MKKILFSLVALVCSMSMNAQVMKVMMNDKVVAVYPANIANQVVFVDEVANHGTATATIDGKEVEVEWVQLWLNGPKFATYNVGTSDAEPNGGYYAWGGSQNRVDDHATGLKPLEGDTDTATKLWGENWRMPTEAEYADLIANCTSEWMQIDGVSGRMFTGKGEYAGNNVFFPAAGYCNLGSVTYLVQKGSYGFYWTSQPGDDTEGCYLRFNYEHVGINYIAKRTEGYSVRAVLAE